MARAKFRIGQTVRTTMGVRRVGVVIKGPVPKDQWSDGTYRYPGPREDAVWVQWQDGTKGWAHAQHLAFGSGPLPGGVKGWHPLQDRRTDHPREATRKEYEVVVGNIGTVYRGSDPAKAGRTFNEYVEQSKSRSGRASGEDVTLFSNGEPIREHIGADTDFELGERRAHERRRPPHPVRRPHGQTREAPRMRAPGRLDSFTRQYMETALWSSTDESRDDGGDPLDKNYGIDDIAPETRDKMIADCADFQERFNDVIVAGGADFERAGHDFWLTRNGHGAGFWDGDWPEPQATELTDASKEYGEFNLYVGDDGLIYGS